MECGALNYLNWSSHGMWPDGFINKNKSIKVDWSHFCKFATINIRSAQRNRIGGPHIECPPTARAPSIQYNANPTKSYGLFDDQNVTLHHFIHYQIQDCISWYHIDALRVFFTFFKNNSKYYGALIQWENPFIFECKSSNFHKSIMRVNFSSPSIIK